ncbi:outer membrane beta-barrel protein [Algoriphagus formosus]|uniref:outer membrane beta-barrel protein n=1 Tax=Algoriphagus formosus TaxID=2007308 RepID=UPI000C28CE14|nr:outer membrane beta-barrel protein [Algoriphagus formosus]
MKKTFLFIAFISLSLTSLKAQEDPETLFDGKLSFSNLGVFVDPGFQATQVAGENTGYFLFRGGMTFGDKLSLGGFYGQMVNDIRPASFENILPARAHVDSYQAGGFIEYTLQASKMVHLTFPLSFGIMELEVDEEGRDFDYEETKTFFVEPGAQVEVNLHRFARLHAGVGYRVMTGSIEDFPGVPEAGNALTFQIGLKMGVFNFNQLKNR